MRLSFELVGLSVGILGLVIGLLGVIPTVILLRERIGRRRPLRRVFDFRSQYGVEIIVTTSQTGISDVGPPDGPRALRSLIPTGDLAGVAEICAMLTKGFPSLPFVITPSKFRQDDRRRDQILVGVPIHNRYTAQLVCGERRSASDSTPVVFDASERYIKMGNIEQGPNIDLKFDEQIPTIDYAVILLTRVSRFDTKQRVVAVGGLTTYGTHAGAHFLAHGLAQYIEQEGLGKSPNVCILLRAALVNGQPYDLQPLYWIPIKEIGVYSGGFEPASSGL